jgi:nucleoside-diphosphate-sugar epimerase
MNYYISGISGFIGDAIRRYLQNKGESVHAIPHGQSIYNIQKLFWFIKPDYIINLASYGNHYNQKDFAEMVNGNILNTYNILEAASYYDYIRFYHVSTSSVVLKNQTPYSITKYCGEQLTRMYKNVTIARPYSVFGPGEADHRLVPTIILCLNSGKEMTLDEGSVHAWLYIDDMIEALFDGETELGNTVVYSNKEIVTMLEEISGKKLNYKPGKLRSYDNKDWPTGNVESDIYEGLKKTYESINNRNNGTVR